MEDNQLILGLIIAVIGAGVAAFLNRTVGLVLAGIGVLVMLLALLTGTADAAVLL